MMMATRASSASGVEPRSVSMASALHELERRGPTRRYFQFLRAAVATGDVLAHSHMGEWLLEGRRDRTGVILARAPKRAVEYLRHAASRAEPSALRALGDCHADGVGTRRDLAAAERCYRKGSRIGDHAAAFNLAILYRDRADRPKERYWLRRAERLGDSTASLVLAEMNLAGRQQRIARQARRYLERMSRSSDVNARDEAREILQHFDRTGRRRWADIRANAQ
jgi:TPR repeat protein